ncbi:MAG: aspartyl-phosphate phosphatase Spo0E family protein [Thermotaleaceae bacterium]
MYDLSGISLDIENMRIQMHDHISLDLSLRDPNILSISQELDKLIVGYYRFRNRPEQ